MQRLAGNAADFSNRSALITHEGEFSYSKLYARVGVIQGILEESKAAVSPLIGVMTGDDVGTYASILAILACGAGYVPISRTYPASRVQQILEQAEVQSVLTSGPHPALNQAIQASPSAIKILNVDGLEPDQGRVHFAQRSKDDIAYVFFTSGSTGKPKGVPITFRNLDAFFAVLLAGSDYGFTEEDRFLQMFSLTFDLSVMSLFVPLAVGGCCCVVPETGIAWLQIIETLRSQGGDGSLDGPVGPGLPGALLQGDPPAGAAPQPLLWRGPDAEPG